MRRTLRHRNTTPDASLFRSSLILPLIILPHLVCAQIKVLSPTQLVTRIRELSGDRSSFLPGATATFGAPSYGESFVGRLFYASSVSSHCQPDYQEQIERQLSLAGVAPESKTHLIGQESSIGGEKAEAGDVIGPRLRRVFLLDRGNCTFVHKVAVAESLGADAVIIRDYAESPWKRQDLLSIIMADDGRDTRVQIPSVMVTGLDGSVLQEFAGRPDTLLQLQWTLPQRSVVTLDFWTESGSSAGQRFLKDFAPFSHLFGPHLRFTPHYNVFSLGSPGLNPTQRSAEGVSEIDSGEAAFDSALCLPNNKFICSNPPDVVKSGLSGRDVLQEDARQLCLWEATAQSAPDVPLSKFSPAWWSYIAKLSDECPMDASAARHFGEECSYGVMRTIGDISEEKVKDCVQRNMTLLLEDERANHAWGNLALRINAAKFSGSLDAALVAKAVCSAFQAAPKACSDILGPVSPGLDPSDDGAPLRRSTGVASLLISGALVSAVVGVGICLHQRHLKKTMRASLRHEVMLEVRSQLQDYHQLEERDTVLSVRGGAGGGSRVGASSNSARGLLNSYPMLQRKALIPLDIADGGTLSSSSAPMSSHTRLDPL